MYAKVLAEAWRKENERAEELAHSVEGTTMRHSASGKCARQIHYYLNKTEVSNPFDLPSIWIMGLGTRIHEWWQGALKAAFPTAKVEVTTHLPEADSSGHIDATIDEEDGTLTALELKSINGFGFKKMAENGDGPRYSDFVQLCMNAHAAGADLAVLVYIATEAVSKNRAKQKGLYDWERVTKEFHFTKEEFTPVAIAEMERWAAIREAGEATLRQLPDPEYIPGALVADPSNGKMTVAGKVVGYAWQCNYCSYQDRCCEDLSNAE